MAKSRANLYASGPVTSQRPRPPARRWSRGRVALVVLGIVALAVNAAVAWLLRDPTPYFHQRRTRLLDARGDTLGRDSLHVTERLTVRATSGLSVQMLLRRPAPDSSGSIGRRPIFILLGGYTTGQRAATLIPDTFGNVVVALAYPYEGDVRVKGLAVMPEVPRIRRAILDTPPAVMLALDYLLSRPDVDPARVELVGASFGTPFATVVGALDGRVTRVWSVHGAGEPYTLISHNLRGAIPFAPARALVAGMANVLAAGPRLAPEHWAPRIAPRPFVMINATGDERLPREAVITLYEAARQPKQLVWLPGLHVQSNRTEVLQSLVRTVLRHAEPATPRDSVPPG